jgi:serine protease inhibitor
MKPVLLLMLFHLSIRATSGAVAGPASASVPPAINALGVDMYRAPASQSDGNLLFSPYSIEVALAMAQAGADGETKTEIQRVLHLTGPDEVAAKEFGRIGWTASDDGREVEETSDGRKEMGRPQHTD